jgi:hypothetical protein
MNVALMARGTALWGLAASPAATVTKSIPPKEYNAKINIWAKAENPPKNACPSWKFDSPWCEESY